MGEQREGERLQKVLARAGLGSRRSCEQLIAEGRVLVNGREPELGVRVDPERDRIEVDGVEISLSGRLVYYALHKPEGVVTTVRDPQGRRTVLELVPVEPRVFPVGRLDYDTSGLLLLTNDGDFANRIAHPRYEVSKTYVAEVQGKAERRHTNQLRKGVQLPDGRVRVEAAKVLDRAGGRSLLELVVHEGRHRMVRRLLEEIGLPVVSLVRTSVGPVGLGRLDPGDWRPLSRTEVMELLRVSEQETETTRRPGARPGPENG